MVDSDGRTAFVIRVPWHKLRAAMRGYKTEAEARIAAERITLQLLREENALTDDDPDRALRAFGLAAARAAIGQAYQNEYPPDH